MPRVLIFHREAEAHEAELRARVADIDLLATADEGELRRALPESEILLTFQFPLDALPTASRLRWIQVTSAGTEFLAPAPRTHRPSARDQCARHPCRTDRRLCDDGDHDVLSDFPALLRDQAARVWQRRSRG